MADGGARRMEQSAVHGKPVASSEGAFGVERGSGGGARPQLHNHNHNRRARSPDGQLASSSRWWVRLEAPSSGGPHCPCPLPTALPQAALATATGCLATVTRLPPTSNQTATHCPSRARAAEHPSRGAPWAASIANRPRPAACGVLLMRAHHRLCLHLHLSAATPAGLPSSLAGPHSLPSRPSGESAPSVGPCWALLGLCHWPSLRPPCLVLQGTSPPLARLPARKFANPMPCSNETSWKKKKKTTKKHSTILPWHT